MPSSRMPGSRLGEPGSYTLDGPPLSTIPAGFFAATSAEVMVCGTISEYTLASRTRRAISWAYCAPKSTTSTGRCSVSLNGCLHARRPLEFGDFRSHQTRQEVFDDEREERHDAAGGNGDESAERPAHEAPQAEVGEQVDDVEPAMCDQDAGAQVHRRDGADRHECE